MYTLVLASQKGGSGKTTLSGHLAVEAERCGAGPVALLDTDPQGSLSQWWNARKSETPRFAKVGLLDLGEALNRLRESGIKLVIIDTPPAITASIAQVVAHADLVLVPTRPSPHDLRAVGATVDIAERNGKPLIFVVNGATARARITGEAAVALSQHGTVAPVTVHHRVDFAASMVDGRTVNEVVPKSASSREVSDLWVYVQDRLSRLMKDPNLTPEYRPQHLAVSGLSPLDAPSPGATDEAEEDVVADAFEPVRAEPVPVKSMRQAHASVEVDVVAAEETAPSFARPEPEPEFEADTQIFVAHEPVRETPPTVVPAPVVAHEPVRETPPTVVPAPVVAHEPVQETPPTVVPTPVVADVPDNWDEPAAAREPFAAPEPVAAHEADAVPEPARQPEPALRVAPVEQEQSLSAPREFSAPMERRKPLLPRKPIVFREEREETVPREPLGSRQALASLDSILAKPTADRASESENLPPKVWEGTDRRAANDRRQHNVPFGGVERRAMPFGRRATDRPDYGAKK